MSQVDVVIVAYNNRRQLRSTVEPLVPLEHVRVIVVDNDSPDGSAEAVADLPVTVIRNSSNLGFAKACNIGWRSGSSPMVLFLNPDAALDANSLGRLVQALETSGAGLVAPRTVSTAGELVHSQRRFAPPALSLWAQTFFLHRLFPRASWIDGIVRDPASYNVAGSPDWVSGACMLVPRPLLERTGGFDERFFMYCEDMDLCRQIRRLGLDIRYEPAATVVHDEGSSAPSEEMTPVLVRSRFAYAEKHLAGTHLAAARTAIAAHAGSRTLITHARRILRRRDTSSPSQHLSRSTD